MEPWWKRRMEAQVKQLNKDLWHINTLIERKNIKETHKDGMVRRFKIKQKGLSVTRDKTKERTKLKSYKMKGYQSRINQYHQNHAFKNNQGKFSRELNSGERNYKTTEVSDKKETQEFWGVSGEKEKNRNIWNGLTISRRTLNTKRTRRSRHYSRKDQEILREMPNWKAPGPDFVQGFWLKNFESIQERL